MRESPSITPLAPKLRSPRDSTNDVVIERVIAILHRLLQDYELRNFRIKFWNGATMEPENGQPARFTLIFHSPHGLRHFLTARNELELAEGYIFGQFDMEGEIQYAEPLADYLLNRSFSLAEKIQIVGCLIQLARAKEVGVHEANRQRFSGKRHSRARDKEVVSYHYDVSNDFYSQWLDSNMVYSCAYFSHANESLEVAQLRKLEHICRKLRLRKGERLLDIGCGWGAMLIHAAQCYGVETLGVTLSESQAALARERIQRLGLSQQCRVVVMDYRDLPEMSSFDKVVSVGMFEHVGKKEAANYFGKALRLLRPGGVFLNHAIAMPRRRKEDGEPNFIDAYVFPDGELLSISETQQAAESVGFELRDLENLREHYELTLRHWVKGLEFAREEAVRAASETTWRIWRLYMAACAQCFHKGSLQVYQSLYSKPDQHGRSHLPLTREDWYGETECKILPFVSASRQNR